MSASLPTSSEPVRVSRNNCLAAQRVYERRAVWMAPEGSLQCLPFHRGPESIARRERGDRIVRSASPDDAFVEIGLQRHQALRSVRPEVSCISIADPPSEGCLRLRIAGIVFPLQD